MQLPLEVLYQTAKETLKQNIILAVECFRWCWLQWVEN